MQLNATDGGVSVACTMFNDQTENWENFDLFEFEIWITAGGWQFI